MYGKRDEHKLQASQVDLIMQELLRDEDNKYCVDCDAKGPRWTSWNLGVFLCIRCAGIHRKLGNMLDMGNSRGRAVYEARLPNTFQRPLTESAVETFIREKYENRRYIAQEYTPNPPNINSVFQLLHRLEQATKRKPISNPVNIGQIQNNASPRPKPSNTINNKAPAPVTVNLIDIESDSNKDPVVDLFSNQQKEPQQRNPQAEPSQHTQHQPPSGMARGFSDIQSSNSVSSSTFPNLFSADLNISTVNTSLSDCQPAAVVPALSSTDQQTKSTKESILALYSQYNNIPGRISNNLPTGWAVPNGSPVVPSVQHPNQNMQAATFPSNQFGAFTTPNMFQQTQMAPETMNGNQAFSFAPGQPVQQNPNMWNMTGFNSQQMSSSTGFGFMMGAAPTPPASGEAYLSQVNNQLASLQSGRMFNN